MGSFTLSLIFGAGIFTGTIISLVVVRKTGVYNYVWNQIKRKNHWVNLLQWFVLTLFVEAVLVGFGSLINRSESVIQFIVGLGLGLMMALLPMKKVN